jgi:hypothetical protein
VTEVFGSPISKANLETATRSREVVTEADRNVHLLIGQYVGDVGQQAACRVWSRCIERRDDILRASAERITANASTQPQPHLDPNQRKKLILV